MWSFFQKNHYLGFNCFLPSQGIQAFIGLGLYAYSTSVNGKKGSKAFPNSSDMGIELISFEGDCGVKVDYGWLCLFQNRLQ